MKVKRCVWHDAPIELIDRLAGNYFFSSTAFAKLWESMGGQPVYWLVEENGQIIAILPGVEFGAGIFRRFQSMVDGCYSRILGDELPNQVCLIVAEQLADHLSSAGYVKVFINDFYNFFSSRPNFVAEPSLTHLVDISALDWAPPDSKLRQQIHQAERQGLKIEPFDAARHMPGFMKLVRLHEKRRNINSRYHQKFFEALAETFLNDDRIIWVWCEHEGKPAESSIFFREGAALIHWQMYYDEALSHLQATKFIPYKIAKDAALKGMKSLNLGVSPAGAEGAEFYKSKWGGSAYTYNTYVYNNFLGRLW